MKSFGGTPRGERLERIKASLPVHWGTFNLAMHAWDHACGSFAEAGSRQRARDS